MFDMFDLSTSPQRVAMWPLRHAVAGRTNADNAATDHDAVTKAETADRQPAGCPRSISIEQLDSENQTLV
jgi:hypothetical protein